MKSVEGFFTTAGGVLLAEAFGCRGEKSEGVRPGIECRLQSPAIGYQCPLAERGIGQRLEDLFTVGHRRYQIGSDKCAALDLLNSCKGQFADPFETGFHGVVGIEAL